MFFINQNQANNISWRKYIGEKVKHIVLVNIFIFNKRGDIAYTAVKRLKQMQLFYFFVCLLALNT